MSNSKAFRKIPITLCLLGSIAGGVMAIPVMAMSFLMDPIAGRDAQGDKEKFQWRYISALEFEAVRLGYLEKGKRLTTKSGSQAFQALVEEWFPIGTPLAEILPYFEKRKAKIYTRTPSQLMQMYGTAGGILEEGEAYTVTSFSYRVGIFSKHLLTMYYTYDEDDPLKRVKKINAYFSVPTL
jgi:hypothetical protein